MQTALRLPDPLDISLPGPECEGSSPGCRDGGQVSPVWWRGLARTQRNGVRWDYHEKFPPYCDSNEERRRRQAPHHEPPPTPINLRTTKPQTRWPPPLNPYNASARRRLVWICCSDYETWRDGEQGLTFDVFANSYRRRPLQGTRLPPIFPSLATLLNPKLIPPSRPAADSLK